MSKKNILKKEKVGNALRISFQNSDGVRVYEYRGTSVKAIERGRDPQELTGGKLINYIPEDKQHE